MATVIGTGRTPGAPLGIIHAVLGVLATADTWRGEPLTDTFARLLESLDGDDAVHLPAAVGECLMPLRGSPDELNLALDLITGFDLHEAASGLVPLLRETPDGRAAQTAAAMASHPAVPPLVGELAELAAGKLAEGSPDLPTRVRMLLTGELPPGSGDAEAWLFAERWPGRVPLEQAAAPLVVLCEDAGSAAQNLEFLLEARRAGSQVRRLPGGGGQEPPDDWLPTWAVMAAAEERPGWWPQSGAFRRTDGSLGPARRRQLLRWMAKRLHGSLALRSSGLLQTWDEPLDDPLLSIDAFLDGALRIPEVSFLTGWSGTTVRNRGKDHEDLQPRTAGPSGIPVFDFAQLTALRVERYVTREFGKRSDPELASLLVKRARSERSVPTHVTDTGQVLFEEDAETVVDKYGQASFKPVALGEVARSFEIGMGRTVPELLRPSTYTRVHPSVQRGTPVVEGTRISATAVRDVVARGRKGHLDGEELMAFVNDYFPELEADRVRDAADVGQRILV